MKYLSENSENRLNPIIIRIRKPYKNENAPYLSFPRKQESRKIMIKEWIPASAGMTDNWSFRDPMDFAF